jgi:hypothetical protein
MSANTGILTSYSGRFHSGLVYYAPTATIPVTGKILGTMYCFLSRVLPWPDEQDPPAPIQTQKFLNTVFKNMFVAKKITTNDISPIIERIDWATGDIYDYYRDDIDMFALDTNGTLLRRFYVKNRFDQVFKCLWNNNGGVSTVEPYFEPGTFNANQIFQGADDYKWKYMYTITSGLKVKFMDSAWMPVPIGTKTPNPLESFAGYGDIEVINVTNGGSNYDSANAAVIVTITGDGSLASANAIISSGAITDITVANTGTNYTYANVTISSAQGSGATAVAYVSPVGGHGFDSITELGAKHVMVTASFNKNEGGNLPTDIDYRQIGVLVDPFAYFGTTYGTANAEVYKTTTDLIVSSGFGSYVPDEIVFQAPTSNDLDEATFSATVLSFDSTTNTLRLINTLGTANTNAIIYGNSTSTARLVLQKQTPSFVPFSGNIIYLENREAVQRNSDGSEQFKLVLGY